MKQKVIYLLVIIFLISSCTIEEVSRESDLTIVTANILKSNKNSANNITSTLLRYNADVYLLHDAQVGNNIDRELFLEHSYSIYSHSKSSISSYNGIIASKIPTEFESLDLKYEYKNPKNGEDTTVFPFYALRVVYNSVPISIIGVHVPHNARMSKGIEKVRERVFKDIGSIIDDGKLSKSFSVLKEGDYVILGGDFNTLSSDPLFNYILNKGMEDSVLTNPDKYDYSWSPVVNGPNLARIDYIFYSKHLNAVYNDCIDIPGSDHKGVITGIDISNTNY